MLYVVPAYINNYLVTWFMWSASCLSPPLILCLLTLCLVSLRQQVLRAREISELRIVKMINLPEYKANNYHDYERNDNNESVTVHQMMYFSWHIIVTVIMIFMITNFCFVLREIAVSHKYLTISF